MASLKYYNDTYFEPQQILEDNNNIVEIGDFNK